MAAPSKTLPNNLSLYRYRRTNKSYTEDLGEGVKLVLMLIPAGEFVMGASQDEPGSYDDERPQHRVTVPQFLMGCYPVTQAQWRVVAAYPKVGRDLDPEPSRFKGDNRPVENVSWEDAQEFCQRLSAKTGKDYRLPSEAQWEYACRAVPAPPTPLPQSGGSVYPPFHFGEMITPELANYHTSVSYNGSPTTEYRGETTEVGSFPANDWGLYDMHGNVWEWCEDEWHDSYQEKPDRLKQNGNEAWGGSSTNKNDNRSHSVRGGSWSYFPRLCRSACRDFYTRVIRDDVIGFRVCCLPARTLVS